LSTVLGLKLLCCYALFNIKFSVESKHSPISLINRATCKLSNRLFGFMEEDSMFQKNDVDQTNPPTVNSKMNAGLVDFFYQNITLTL
jgi:hypothetical protein